MLHDLQTVPPEDLDPRNDEPGAPHHDVERPERQLLSRRQPLDAFDEEFEVGFDRCEPSASTIMLPWMRQSA